MKKESPDPRRHFLHVISARDEHSDEVLGIVQ